MEAAEKFSTELGTAPACRAFGVSRASLYRRRQRAAAPAAERPRPRSHRALSGADRQEVLDCYIAGASWIRCPPKCVRPCWMQTAICARYARCTGFWSQAHS